MSGDAMQIQMGAKTRAAFEWVVANEGLCPGQAVSTAALTNLRALGLAEPNQPGRRRRQEDHWWLTERGIALAESWGL